MAYSETLTGESINNVWAISTWIKINTWNTVDYPNVVGLFSGFTATGPTFSLYGLNKLRVQAPGGISIVSDNSIELSTGVWYHFAARSDGSEVRLMVNGFVCANKDVTVSAIADTNNPVFNIANPASGFDWDVDDTVIWKDGDIPSLADIAYWALDGNTKPANDLFTYTGAFDPTFTPVVVCQNAFLADSGLLTLEFNLPTQRGVGADNFPYEVAWRIGQKHCHAVTTGLMVGDDITIPLRFIEVTTTGDFNAEQTIEITADDELTDVPATGPLKLAGIPQQVEYFSESFLWGNDLQKINGWYTDSSRTTRVALASNGIPVANAVCVHNNSTPRRYQENYHIYWQGAGEFYFGSVGVDNPIVDETVSGWRHKEYAAGFTNVIVKTGTITAMKACWDNDIADIDNPSNQFSRDLWAPYSMCRLMQVLGTNVSYVSEPEHLADDGHVGLPYVEGDKGWFGINLPVVCRAMNDIGFESVWFNMPHLASPECMQKFFEQVRDYLDTDIEVYAEFGNEIWNYSGSFDRATKWLQNEVATPLGLQYDDAYAYKAKQMEDIGIAVLGSRYTKTVLAGQFGVPSKANNRYTYAVARGMQRPIISNALYFSPDVIYDDPYTRNAFAEMTPEHLIDLVKWSINLDGPNFEIIREFTEQNNIKCIPYEGGWAFSTPTVNAFNYDAVADIALRAPLHPLMVNLHHYMFGKAIAANFSHFMYLAPEGGIWNNEPLKFKTWKDRNRWDQVAGAGAGNMALTTEELFTDSESTRAYSAVAWTVGAAPDPPDPGTGDIPELISAPVIEVVNDASPFAGNVLEVATAAVYSDPSNGDVVITYRWFLNGVFQSTGTTFATDGLAVDDEIICYSRGTNDGGFDVAEDGQSNTITITSSNVFSPTDITISSSTIKENSPYGSLVGYLSAADQDINESFEYELVSGTGDTDNATFIVQDTSDNNGGFLWGLYLNDVADASDTWSVRIQVTDLGGHTFAKAFAISGESETTRDSLIAEAVLYFPMQEITGTTYADEKSAKTITPTGSHSFAAGEDVGPETWLPHAAVATGSGAWFPFSAGIAVAAGSGRTYFAHVRINATTNQGLIAGQSSSGALTNSFRKLSISGSASKSAAETINQWVKIAVSYDGTNTTFWYDGTVQVVAGPTNGASTLVGFGATNHIAEQPLLAGAMFAGVGVINRPCSVGEIEAWFAGYTPVNTVAPSISGDDDGLTCSTGTWDSRGNGTIVYTYQWLRDSVVIPGATDSTYVPVLVDDAGTDLSCVVRATNDGGYYSANDTESSNAYSVGAGDTPELTSITVTAASSSSLDVAVSMDVIGTLHYFVSTSASPPASAAVLKAGTGATTNGARSVTSTGAQTFTITGLSPNTLYYVYLLGTSVEGNDSTIETDSGGDTTEEGVQPTCSTLTVATNGIDVTAVFSEAVTVGDDAWSGLVINGIVLNYVSGTGTDTIVFEAASIIGAGTVTSDYVQPGDGIQDAAENLLASFSDKAVFNGSTQEKTWQTIATDITLPFEVSNVQADDIGRQFRFKVNGVVTIYTSVVEIIKE